MMVPHYFVSAHGLLVLMPASQAILIRVTLLYQCSWTFDIDASISSYPGPLPPSSVSIIGALLCMMAALLRALHFGTEANI
jgi:hypothetical protein